MSPAEARFRVNALIRETKEAKPDFEKLASDEHRIYRDIFEAILSEADNTTRVVDYSKQALRILKSEHPRWG